MPDSAPVKGTADAGQARPDHGGDQRPLARLGHRRGLRRAGRGAGLHLPGARRWGAGCGRWRRRSGSDRLFLCDVGDEASIDAAFAALREQWDGLDFLVHAIAFADKAVSARALPGHAARGVPAGAGHLLLFVRRGGAARGADDAAGRQPADADLCRRGALDAALQRDGRGEGGAGGVGALSGGRSGRAGHPGERDQRRADPDRWRRPGSAISTTSCAGTS